MGGGGLKIVKNCVTSFMGNPINNPVNSHFNGVITVEYTSNKIGNTPVYRANVLSKSTAFFDVLLQ